MTNPVNYKHTPVRVVMDQPVMCRFDYPDQTGHQFLFSIPKCFEGNNTDLLERVLGSRVGHLRRMRQIPEDLREFRVYSIDEYIPDFIKRRLGYDRDVPGPNCYQAALASLGFSDLEGRHVDPLEAGFYFSRYFENVQGDPALGDVRIYYEAHRLPASALGFAAAEEPEPALIDIMEHAHDIPPDIGASCVHMFNLEETPEWYSTVLDAVPDISDESLDSVTAVTAIAPADQAEDLPEIVAELFPVIKPGVHAAVVLLGGTVFQRGGWHDDHANRVVPAAVAMSSIEPISDDPFYPVERADDADYSSRVIRRLSSQALLKRMSGRVVDQELTAAVGKHLLLLDYYSKRMQAVADANGTFSGNRLNLLTMENVWTILSESEAVIRGSGHGMARSLLRMRDDVAQEFLKFRSLKWQYSAMVQRYSTLSRTAGRHQKKEYMQELYRDHYVDPDSDSFAREINVHLRMRGIPTQKFPAIRTCVIEKVKEQSTDDHLIQYAESNGSQGIDFFKILEEAIDR